MRRLGLFLLALSSVALAQDSDEDDIPPVVYPAVAKSAASPAAFVPKGWKQVQLAEGDLNRDGQADFAMVVRMDSEANRVALSWEPERRFDTNPWMLIAAFRKGAGYELALADHSLIPRHENPSADEEFGEIKVANGTLKVVTQLFMSMGGWEMGSSSYTFRWQDGGFKLIGFDRDEVHRGSGATTETSINYLTGKKLLRIGNIETDERKSTETKIAMKPLLDLGAIGNGLEFDPDRQ